MKTAALLLAALCLLATNAGAQVRKAVTVDTNGVIQFPTNFWEVNAGSNIQEFIGSNNFAFSAQTLNYTTNRGQYLIRQQNVLRILNQTNLEISQPHALLAVGNNIYAFKRAMPTGGTPNAEGVVFSNVHQSLSNKALLTFTNGSHIPEAVYDPVRGLIYAASVTAGTFQIATSNNAVSQFATNSIDIGGSIAQDADHIYLGWSNVVQKIAKSSGSTTATITNTNLTDIHALRVSPDQTKLVGSTAGDPGKAFVVTLSNFAFSQVAASSNSFIFTDDFAADNTDAWFSAEGGEGAVVRYSFASNNFTTVAPVGAFYFVTEHNGILYAGGPSGAVSFTKDGSVYTEFYTTNNVLNEMVAVGDDLFMTDYTSSASLFRVRWESSLNRMTRDEADFNLSISNIALTNTNNFTPPATGAMLERFAWLRVTAQSEPGNVNLLNYMNANKTRRRVGDRIVVQNSGTNTVNVRRGTISPPIIRALGPNQIFEAVAVGVSDTETIWFTNSIASIGVPALANTSNATVMRALSGSTNTNHPFSGTISVVGTNNTNTLTFSNGILQSLQ